MIQSLFDDMLSYFKDNYKLVASSSLYLLLLIFVSLKSNRFHQQELY